MTALKQVEMIITAAYTGSAEHGSFFRHGGGEMSPNAFLVLEELQAHVKKLEREKAEALAQFDGLALRCQDLNHEVARAWNIANYRSDVILRLEREVNGR